MTTQKARRLPPIPDPAVRQSWVEDDDIYLPPSNNGHCDEVYVVLLGNRLIGVFTSRERAQQGVLRVKETLREHLIIQVVRPDVTL